MLSLVVIGAGHVGESCLSSGWFSIVIQIISGGPAAAVIALHNSHIRVTVVDRDEARIRAWNSHHLPIHEPGLVDIVRVGRDGIAVPVSNTSRQLKLYSEDENDYKAKQSSKAARSPNLFFSTACAETIATADMILISINTPTKRHGVGAGKATDMGAFEAVIYDIATYARPSTVLVEKSTVPCKTGQLIKDMLEAYRPGVVFPILSNPEFLSEGTAIRDLTNPDRVIIGCEASTLGYKSAASLVNIYAAWVPRAKIVPINIWSSELCKLTANAMLAQRISSINSISAICEKTGADVSEVARAIGMDDRIGPHFLKAGLGFGGSCFRKDIASLVYLAESLGLPEVAEYWQQVLSMDQFQRNRFARNIISSLNNTLRHKKVTIFGFAFKKDTGDARESPALDLIRILLEENPQCIAIFDPLCSALDITEELQALQVDHPVMKPEGPVEILIDPYAAASDSNAILVLTDLRIFEPEQPTTTPEPLQGEIATQKAPLETQKTRRQYCHPSHLSQKSTLRPSGETECIECEMSNQRRSSCASSILMPLDWYRVSEIVREPRWVFDGRGVLDPRILTSAGFRLETPGRASLY